MNVASHVRRATLARWMLRGWDADLDASIDAGALDALKEQAWSEGVVVLASDQLARGRGTPAHLRQFCLDWCRSQARAELARRARLREVLACVEGARIDTLVLKGAALAEWAYPVPYLREFSDVDLLFASRDDALRASEALRMLGYAMSYVPGRFMHELSCRNADGVVDLDLHWALSDMPALTALPGFDDFRARSIPLPGLGPCARGPGPEDALLHACIHRASNLQAGLGDRLKWLYDIHLLARALDAPAWASVVRRGREARVCGILLDGLEAMRALFSPPPRDVLASLREAAAYDAVDWRRLHDWNYLQRMNMHALPGARRKLQWIWSRLFPPTGFMREAYGMPRAGRARLLGARFVRMLVRIRGGTAPVRAD